MLVDLDQKCHVLHQQQGQPHQRQFLPILHPPTDQPRSQASIITTCRHNTTTQFLYFSSTLFILFYFSYFYFHWVLWLMTRILIPGTLLNNTQPRLLLNQLTPLTDQEVQEGVEQLLHSGLCFLKLLLLQLLDQPGLLQYQLLNQAITPAPNIKTLITTLLMDILRTKGFNDDFFCYQLFIKLL